MKHFIYKILAIVMLAIPFASRSQNDSVQKKIVGSNAGYQIAANNFLANANFTEADLKKITDIYRAQQDCIGISTGDCADFCEKPKCIEKILTCHEIKEGEFDLMTDRKKSGHAIFPRWQIHRMLKDANCSGQRIRFRIDENDTYILTRVDTSSVPTTTRPAGINRETHYSIALLQGIFNKRHKGGLFKLFNKKIKSVTLYRGVVLSPEKNDDPSKEYYLIPFIVTFGDGSIGYFDVSETQP